MAAESGSNSITLFIILDGFRHDYMDRVRYLRSIADWNGKVREPFGFISTRPAMFAGVYPEETNLAFEYKYKPEGSAFSPQLFGTLKAVSHLVPGRWLRLMASAWLRMTSRNQVIRQTALIGNMPFDQFPLFDLSESQLQTDPGYLSVPTFYDLLREQRQDHLYYGFARPKKGFEAVKRAFSYLIKKDLYEADRTMTDQFLAELPKKQPPFAHLHYSTCDWVGHKFGPNSPQMNEAVLVVDELVKKVHDCAKRYYQTVRLLVTADHGMVEVHKSYNLNREVLDLVSYSEPKDYICFRDSTMARFWFFHPRAEEAIREKLDSLSWGHVVEDEQRARHRIRFPDNSNGDLIFLLDPGIVLMPNYYQATGLDPKGMHGYDPECLDNQGAIVIHNAGKRFQVPKDSTIDLVDIFPTLCDLQGLAYQPHGSMRSLFTEHRNGS